MRTPSRLPIRDTQPQSQPQSLPGFQEIMRDIGPACPRCHIIPESSETVHHCYATGEGPSRLISRGRNYSAGLEGQTSSASSVVGLPSGVPTPANSRSPSVSGSVDGGYDSSFEDPGERKCTKCGFACGIQQHVKGEKKKRKEQKARRDQAVVLQNAEDMFACLYGWKPSKTQSAGNGNAAGVETPKIELMRILFLFSLTHLESGLLEAIKAGHEEAWKTEVRRKLNASLARWQPNEEHPRGPSYDPSFDGSLMELTDKQRPCHELKAKGGKGRGSKRCGTHLNSGRTLVECRKGSVTTACEERLQEARRRLAGLPRV